MKLLEFRDLLLEITPNVFHYEAKGQADGYIVWAEYGDKAQRADNARLELEKTWKIQVDYFTKREFDAVADAIRAALNGAEIPFEYVCDYEKDTKLIHHIFDCEVG